MDNRLTMKRKTVFVLALCLIAGAAVRAQDFDTYFVAKSLRVDFALSGNAAGQSAALEQLREEPVWGGPVKNLVEPFDYGGYAVKVFDPASGKLLYKRSFNTLFEEWRTTAQAKEEVQSWTNSVVVPFPKQPVRVEISGRDRRDMKFYPLLQFKVDPKSLFIDRSPLKENKITRLQYKGDPAKKVDLVFLAEGYTAKEQDKFLADAKRFMETLFATAPYTQRRNDFNVWAVGLVSQDEGTDVSGKGIYKNTALNSGYYTFGLDRYLTTPDMRSIRNAVWNLPCDAVFILVNAKTYGGGGIYNFYAMGTADNARTQKVFVHEFGHAFAGLADEYFSSTVAYDKDFYNLKQEPWEPNITTLVDFASKWKDLMAPSTPIPTPATPENNDKVGVFEGGGYLAKGIYRSAEHCMMRDYLPFRGQPFCAACTRAINRMIDYLSDQTIEK